MEPKECWVIVKLRSRTEEVQELVEVFLDRELANFARNLLEQHHSGDHKDPENPDFYFELWSSTTRLKE